MAQGFWLKTSVGSTFSKVTNFFVKTTTSGWAQITDAWVKTDPYTWSKFFTAKYSPDTNIELLSSYGSDGYTLKLQGKNKHWSPTPSSLKYYFKYVDSTGGTYYIGSGGSSGATATNPSIGSSITYPSSTTYITIDPKGSNYSIGGTATYYFEVRAFDSGGNAYPAVSQEVVQISTPQAPIVTATPGINSVTLSIKSASQNDWYLTNRYIVYTSDSVGGLIESGGGRGGYGIEASYGDTKTVTLTGLTPGRTYSIYVAPFTGSTGSTTANATGYAGIEAYVSSSPISPYTFNFGNTLYVGTNGYIGLDSGSTSDSILSTVGRVLGILPGDLFQSTNSSIWYWSNTSEFRIRWEGYHFGQASNTRIYEVTFYSGQTYATVYAATVSNTTEGTEAFVDGGVAKTNYPSALTSGSAYNVSFDGTTSPITYLGYSPKSTGVMVQVSGLTSGSQDQGYTAITTATNQQTAVPSNTSVPTWTLMSGNANKVGSVYRLSVGSWSGNPTSYEIHLFRNDQSSYDTTGFPVTIYSPNTYYDWTATASNVSLALAVLATNNAGQSNTYAYATSSFGPITAIAATAPTSVSAANNGSTDTVTVSWSGATSATVYRIYWNSNGISPGSAATYYDEEKTVNGSTITSTSGSWAWGPSDPDKNGYTPSGRGNNYFMVSASADGVTWTPYVVTSSATGVYISPPSNTSQPTLSGTAKVGNTLTAGVGSWSGSPTSYDLRIYRGTQFVSSGETLVKSAGNVTSTTYTITQADYDSGQRYFRTYASASNSGGSSGLVAGQELGPTTVPVYYTVTWNANGGSVSPSSSTQSTEGGSVSTPTPSRSGYSFNGWYNASSGGSYIVGGGSSYTPSSNTTLYAQWSVVFTAPSSSAPALQFLRTTSTSRLDWYCDYPSISGDGSFTGMQFEIRTTAGGGTLLASGTRAYPGAGVYPYSAAGTVWAFRMGTANGDITYSTSARYGRARTVMLGTNGTTYYSAWTGWI